MNQVNAIASFYTTVQTRLQQRWLNLRDWLYPKLPPLLQDWIKPPDIRRTPTLLQMEAVECGAASLGMILGYHKRIVALAELRQACGISRDGSKASNLLNAGKRYELISKGFKVPLNQLETLPRPFIVFWNFNHFLVVEGFHRGRVFLNDPATGPRSVTWSEFGESFTGVVLTFQPSPAFEPGGAKPSVIKALRSRLQGSFPSLIFCLLVGFLLVLPGLAMPAFSKIFIDQVLIQGRDGWLRPLVLSMIAVAGLTGLLTRLQLQVLRQLKIKLSMSMSSQFIWHILHLPVSFYDQRFAGEISNRIKLNDRLASLLSGELATTTISGVMVLFYGAVMLCYDWVLTLIGVAFIAINLVAMQWVARQRSDTNTRLMQEQGKVSGVAIAGLQSMETLKASGLESDFFTKWAGYYAKSLNARQEMDGLAQRISLVPSFLTGMSTMLLLVIGGLRVMDGVLTIGELVAFQSLMQQFTQPVQQLIKLGGDVQELEGTLSRLDDVLQNPTDALLEGDRRRQTVEEPTPSPSQEGDQTSLTPLRPLSKVVGVASLQELGQRPNSPTSQLPSKTQASASSATVPKSQIAPTSQLSPKLRGQLHIKNLTFGYNLTAPPLIDNFSLSLEPGQRVALVGGSGSGKSTVAKLVCGLYEPWGGEICFDDRPRSAIPRAVLVNSLAMIEQDVLLFSGTVRDNLTLWDTTIPDANLVQACRDAAIHDVILAQPGGYDADLLEGATNLSGGQRQRLEIARALVNNPSILVMDEATSALDTETERMIDYNLRLRGCTCLIVAHRLSTIRDCDEIIVMHRGQIAQRGTHDQLSQVDGPYLNLIRSEGA